VHEHLIKQRTHFLQSPIKFLKPSGNYVYILLYHSEGLCVAHTVYLCVSCVPRNSVVASTSNNFQSQALHNSPLRILYLSKWYSILETSIISELSRDSAVGIATGYGQDNRGVGVRVLVGSRIFSSLRRPDRIWGPSSLLSNGYRELLTRG
jgi:hypothetical protein